MTAATQARWPDVPADVSSLTDPDAARDAALDAALHKAVLEFQASAGRTDGTRTALEMSWGVEFRRLTGLLDAEVSA